VPVSYSQHDAETHSSQAEPSQLHRLVSKLTDSQPLYLTSIYIYQLKCPTLSGAQRMTQHHQGMMMIAFITSQSCLVLEGPCSSEFVAEVIDSEIIAMNSFSIDVAFITKK